MNKKIAMVATAACFVACLALAAGCSPASSGSSSGSAAKSDAAEGSLVAYHQGIGQDISNVTEVSFESCAPCHGDADTIRSKTDDLWKGIGQISDANPHESHATNALECSDCHTLSSGPQVNVCNQCHEFDTPDGWTDMSSQTTTYGITGTEAPYSTYRDLSDVK